MQGTIGVTSDGNDDGQKRQRARSIAIGVALALLVLLFYVATIVRLGPQSLKKDGFGQRPAAPVSAPDCKKAGTC
jgi:hypothetical protein